MREKIAVTNSLGIHFQSGEPRFTCRYILVIGVPWVGKRDVSGEVKVTAEGRLLRIKEEVHPEPDIRAAA